MRINILLGFLSTFQWNIYLDFVIWIFNLVIIDNLVLNLIACFIDYDFKDDDEEMFLVRWENYIVDELVLAQEKAKKELKSFKSQQNVEK